MLNFWPIRADETILKNEAAQRLMVRLSCRSSNLVAPQAGHHIGY